MLRLANRLLGHLVSRQLSQVISPQGVLQINRPLLLLSNLQDNPVVFLRGSQLASRREDHR